MERTLKALLFVALVAAPAPLLAQSAVLGDTVWVPEARNAVGRVITVTLADQAERAALLREEITLPAVEGRAWTAKDLVVSLDLGTRAPTVTWRVAGPEAVVAAFETALRQHTEKQPSTRTFAVRPLVVR